MSQHITPELIVDYVHRELSPEDDSLVYAHLAECAECRALHRQELALTDALRTTLGEARELPPAVKAQIWEAIRQGAPSPWERLAAFFRPVVIVPAGVAVVAAGLVLAFNGAGAPRIDASYYLQEHAAQQARNPLADRAQPQLLGGFAMADASNAPSPIADYQNLHEAAADPFDAAR